MQPGSNFEARIGAVPQQRKTNKPKKTKQDRKNNKKTKTKQTKQKSIVLKLKILALIVQENIF